MRRTRVVHLVEALGLGGLERVVQTLARHASPAYDVEVVALVEGGSLVHELTESVAAPRILGVRSYYPDAIVRTARSLRRIEPDLIHSHGHFAGVLGRSAGWLAGTRGLIHHLHTIDTTLAPRHHRIERFLARLTDRVICCSSAVHRHALAELRLRPHLLRTVPNGIDPPPPADRDEARRLLENPPPPVVGCLGGLAPHKGQCVLIEAWSQMVRAHAPGTLILVGDGQERLHLEQLASATAPGRIRFTGERPDARRLLPAFDVVVVPSLEREGLGLAALEAMDAARPVIASRVGGLVEVVEDGRTGLLVEPGSVEAILAALRTILERPGLGHAFGEESRRRVDSTFRAATMARRVEALYEEVLGVRRAA